MEFETVKIDGTGAVRHLVLNRPEVHNAVNAQLVADVHEAARLLDDVRHAHAYESDHYRVMSRVHDWRWRGAAGGM